MWGYSCLLHSASSVQLEACELQRLLRARTNAHRIQIDAHRSLRTVRASVLTRPLATASRSCCAMGRPSTLKKGSGARVGGAVDRTDRTRCEDGYRVVLLDIQKPKHAPQNSQHVHVHVAKTVNESAHGKLLKSSITPSTSDSAYIWTSHSSSANPSKPGKTASLLISLAGQTTMSSTESDTPNMPAANQTESSLT